MPKVRSKGADIVVRFAGRRLRITNDWADVSEDAVERLLAEPDIEVEGISAPSRGPSAPMETETSAESTGDSETDPKRARSRGKGARKGADTDEE